MLKKVMLVVVLILIMQNNSMAASEIDSTIQKIVKQFIKAYNEKEADFDIATVAVFPFQADEQLSKKKVNVAVSEMLTLHLVKSNKIKVIERNQLESILKEQALGLSGAIASETAAEVGQLLGARLSVLGNVIKVGKYYQISAKLVDTETSEIISAAISEVPIEVFDEEAVRYLVFFTPEYQTIGLYVGLEYAPFIKGENISAETHHKLRITPDNSFECLSNPTMGLRYWAKPKWMLDLSVTILGQKDNANTVEVIEDGVVDNRIFWTGIRGFGGRFTLNRCIGISKRFNGYLGAGYKFFQGSFGSAEVYSKMEDGEIVCENALNFKSYLLRTGIEWKPQDRFGWAMFCNFNSAKDIEIKADIYEWSYQLGRFNKEEMVINKITYPAIHVETTLSLYF